MTGFSFDDPDRAGFAVLLFSGVAGAVLFGLMPGGQAIFWVSGFLMVCWSVLGMWRLSVLSGFLPDSLSSGSGAEARRDLPSVLVRTLGLRGRSQRRAALALFGHPSVLLWVAGGALVFFWTVFSALFPYEPEAVQALRTSMAEILGDTVPHVVWGSVLERLAFLFCVGVMGVLALSYAQGRDNVRMGLKVFVPLFLVVCVLAFRVGFSGFAVLPPVSLQGVGPGTADFLRVLIPAYGEVRSPFLVRYLETGLVGAVLAWVPALPVLLALRASCPDKAEEWDIPALAGLSCLLVLLLYDVFGVSGPVFRALVFSGWLLVALCWGAVEAGNGKREAVRKMLTADLV